jgi:hypothetical protein
MKKVLTDEEKVAYQRDGFLIRKAMFSPEEIALLYNTATDDSITAHSIDFRDTTGKDTKLTLWFTPGDDPFGLMSRSEKLVYAVGELLHSEPTDVCHFHSKVMQKQPLTGGAWEWHQDYGYWYKNGFLYPEAMISVMVALTEANKENGCLQVLKGSHKMQRFEHNFVGEQQGADMDFVEQAATMCDLVYCELQPGDVLFFHSNILHRSDANNSEKSRWSVISAYNLKYNKPFREKHLSCIEPIKIVDDAALLSSGTRQPVVVDFLKKEEEITLHVK